MESMKKAITIGLLAMVFPYMALATESSSSSYILWAEAETGGGNRSTSTNYILQGSTGDLSNEELNSASYRVEVGFEAVYEEPKITLALSATTVALSPNPLTNASVSSGSMTATVSTNADFGYSMTVTETSPFQNTGAYVIADVADTTVSAGVEEFGLAVSGTDAATFGGGGDAPLTSTPLVIASRTIWGTDRTTALTFKAGVTNATPSGSYSGNYTIIATGNY